MAATIASQTIKLQGPTTFRIENADGTSDEMTLPAGTEVAYFRQVTDTEIIHTAHYTDDSGDVWEAITRTKRGQKQQAPAPVTAPAPQPAAPTPIVTQAPVPQPTAPAPQTQSAVQRTAQTAHAALSVVADRQTRAVDADERRAKMLAKTAEMLQGKVYQVNYYIPASLSDEIPNPSKVFRKYGFRLDGSNWVFPEHMLQHKAVQRVFREWDEFKPVHTSTEFDGFFSRAKPRYWVIEYTPEQLEKMKELALEQLSDELIKTHRSLINRIDSAANDLQAAKEALADCATERDEAKLENAFNGRIRVTIEEACERFAMCLTGAQIFDDTGSLDALFESVRAAIATQALAANAMLAAKGVKQVKIPDTILS